MMKQSKSLFGYQPVINTGTQEVGDKRSDKQFRKEGHVKTSKSYPIPPY